MLHLTHRDLWLIFRGAVFEYSEDKVPRMAAAVAFYTLFSLTPIVIIAVAIGGLFFGREAAQREVLNQVYFLIGKEGIDAINLLVKHAPQQQATKTAMFVGLATMFFAATGAFAELKDSLNTIWEVQPKPGLGIVEMIRDRFLSFAMVLVIGFLLVVSLIASAVLSALGAYVSAVVPAQLYLLEMGNFIVSFTVITLLFALIYKVLPDARVHWNDVWVGASVAAILFAIGKTLFGFYLGHSEIGRSYGAAGSLIIVVLWTYYSSLILLFGAELTQVQARLRGVEIVPTEKAVHLTEHQRLQQGLPRKEDIEIAAAEQETEQRESQPATAQQPEEEKLAATGTAVTGTAAPVQDPRD